MVNPSPGFPYTMTINLASLRLRAYLLPKFADDPVDRLHLVQLRDELDFLVVSREVSDQNLEVISRDREDEHGAEHQTVQGL